mgnify:CR=1 FL=1
MKKFILLALLFLTLISTGYSLQTYVGVKIVDLKDDSLSSCAGESSYGSSGRIRALSSILPNFPIYMEVKNSSNDVIATGNVADSDYAIGDVMYFPTELNLTIGADYLIFFDIDAIRVYLDLNSWSNSRKSTDNNYYTIGDVGSSCSGGGGFNYVNSDSACGFTNGATKGCSYSSHMGFSKNRADSYLSWSSSFGSELFGVGPNDFNIDSKYLNLAASTNGNFNIGFKLE